MIISNKHKHKDIIEIVDQSQIEKQKQLLGSVRLKRGHKLFEVNINTQEITEAQYDTQEYAEGTDRNISKRKSLTVKENCIYVGALNKKNVIKILKRNK